MGRAPQPHPACTSELSLLHRAVGSELHLRSDEEARAFFRLLLIFRAAAPPTWTIRSAPTWQARENQVGEPGPSSAYWASWSRPPSSSVYSRDKARFPRGPCPSRVFAHPLRMLCTAHLLEPARANVPQALLAFEHKHTCACPHAFAPPDQRGSPASAACMCPKPSPSGVGAGHCLSRGGGATQPSVP